MSQAVFRWEHRVGYAECTLGDHVYYARYLDLLERARGEFFRRIGLPFRGLQEQGIIFPVIEVRLRYKAPARYDDLISVEVRVVQAAGIRLEFGYRVTGPDGKLLLEGETQHVCTNLQERPQRLPPALSHALQPWSSPGCSAESSGK